MVRTYEDFSEWTKDRPNKFHILTWIPKDHWEYWVIKWKYNACNNSNDKNHYFAELCNFIHKPLLEAFQNLKSQNPKKFNKLLLNSDWEWEVNNETM